MKEKIYLRVILGVIIWYFVSPVFFDTEVYGIYIWDKSQLDISLLLGYLSLVFLFSFLLTKGINSKIINIFFIFISTSSVSFFFFDLINNSWNKEINERLHLFIPLGGIFLFEFIEKLFFPRKKEELMN